MLSNKVTVTVKPKPKEEVSYKIDMRLIALLGGMALAGYLFSKKH